MRALTRRRVLLAGGALLLRSGTNLAVGVDRSKRLSSARNETVEYGRDTLPIGIRSRRVDNNNGITQHLLEAGFETPGRPCVVLLHGFPELAYSWRQQLVPLAQAGFHAIAPDARGYGQSAAAPVAFNDDLLPYSVINRVSDVLGLVRAVGYDKVQMIVGHDWGGPTAQWCARLRPDVFRSVVSMSTPFFGAAVLPLNSANGHTAADAESDIQKELAALPHPRQHYFDYSATADANANMWRAPQGVHDLLRALYYFKSADWEGNRPFPLKSGAATELAKMPAYYIMDLDKGIAETMAGEMPSKDYVAACRWMTQSDLQVYATEFTRTGFQGGLNYYRVGENADYQSELHSFSGRKIDVPACYIGGDREWAVYQSPGAFEAMHTVCKRLIGVHLVTGSGHSIPEEKPQETNRLLLDFVRRT